MTLVKGKDSLGRVFLSRGERICAARPTLALKTPRASQAAPRLNLTCSVFIASRSRQGYVVAITIPVTKLLGLLQDENEKTPEMGSSQSGREDLNLRPLAPHASALAGLRHAPIGKRRL